MDELQSRLRTSLQQFFAEELPDLSSASTIRRLLWRKSHPDCGLWRVGFS